MEQPVEAMAAATAGKMIAALGGAGDRRATPPAPADVDAARVRVFPARLIVRGSTAPPRS